MAKPYKLIVFDWEGTLGDSFGEILQTIIDEANRLGYVKPDRNVAKQYCVLSLPLAIKKMFPDLSPFQLETLQRAVQHRLVTHGVDICLIPGAKEILERLQHAHYFLAIASNKGTQSLQRVLNVSGLKSFFPVTRCAGQVPSKPCPQMLIELMDEYEVKASETLMIGDSTSDMEMAKQVHVDAIGVDFYHQHEHTLKSAGALTVISDYQQLASFLEL